MYLVDTNVLSELNKPRPNLGVLEWFGRQSVVRLSVVTIAELQYGVSRAARSKRGELLAEWLESILTSSSYELVGVDTAIARAAGKLRHQTETAGRPRSTNDLLIAASALTSGATIVTRNTDDFIGLGVGVLNPFS